MKHRSCARLLTLIEQHVPTGRLLDVGAGVGDLVLRACQRDWSARGVEPNAHAVAQADPSVREAIFQGTFEQFEAARGAFDAITCLELQREFRTLAASLA